MKLIFSFILFCFCGNVYSQVNDSASNIIDDIRKVIELRKGFSVSSESTSPALFSYSKKNDDSAVFTIDAAILVKAFKYQDFSVTPFIQFDYTSNGKDRKEKIKSGVSAKYVLYNYQKSRANLIPSVSYEKDFFSKKELLEVKLSFNPSFPDFAVPIFNASAYKFKYNGKDNHWVFGVNPSIGLDYQNQKAPKAKDNYNTYNSFINVGMTLKRYFMQFDLSGRYERDLKVDQTFGYHYAFTSTFYFDTQEIASINAKFEQEEIDTNIIRRKISFGFGVKL
ncbi:MAG: hypothetical protein IAE65_01525 [Ignavibacteria bacterium]|nr:hypothetical protein [Ignavibacteria bacterium]